MTLKASTLDRNDRKGIAGATTGGAAGKAYRGLRALLVNGSFQAGSHLREELLAGRLGVSRTPVREAVRRLAAEGWLEIVPNQGAYVCGWSRHDVEEVFALRAMLEGYAAEWAARNATDAQIAELQLLSASAKKLLPGTSAEDVEQIAELNDRFHKLILEASGQRRTAVTVTHLVELPITLRNFHQFTAADMERSVSQHQALVDAVAARDPAWAGSVMRAHVLSGKAIFMERIGLPPAALKDSSDAPAADATDDPDRRK